MWKCQSINLPLIQNMKTKKKLLKCSSQHKSFQHQTSCKRWRVRRFIRNVSGCLGVFYCLNFLVLVTRYAKCGHIAILWDNQSIFLSWLTTDKVPESATSIYTLEIETYLLFFHEIFGSSVHHLIKFEPDWQNNIFP